MKKCILFLLCLCLIIPSIPYQKVWAEEDSEISEDHSEESLRESSEATADGYEYSPPLQSPEGIP